jgi:hypothetical protein
MKKIAKGLAALSISAALATTFVAPAFAKPLHKCNSGSGNGGEGQQFHDCDPGNSGGRNSGGD